VGSGRRLDELPVYETLQVTLDANRYHHAARAVRELGPLRLPLHGLRELAVVVQADAWVVVDGTLDDLPVMAWSDFVPDPEGPLHRPVRCRLRLFHAHAGLLVERALEALELLLGEALGDPGDAAGRLLPFRRP